MINEVLPIDGWKACGIDITPQGCVVKYKFEDPVFLLCPHDRKPGPTIHRRYTMKVRDLPLGIHRSTLEVEVLVSQVSLFPLRPTGGTPRHHGDDMAAHVAYQLAGQGGVCGGCRQKHGYSGEDREPLGALA